MPTSRYSSSVKAAAASSVSITPRGPRRPVPVEGRTSPRRPGVQCRPGPALSARDNRRVNATTRRAARFQQVHVTSALLEEVPLGNAITQEERLTEATRYDDIKTG
jgi:hypothetical protein